MTDDSEVNYRFECAALGGTIPPLRRVHLVEALDTPYALSVDCVLEDPTLEIVSLLGQDAMLEISRGTSVRRVCGVIREVREADMPDAATTRLAIVPALALLSLRRDTRIFQDKSVPEILEEVLASALGAYGREASLELEGTYPKRELCVQYQESDLDFVQRLMEEEGISYAFDHEDAVERMVLRDRSSSYPELPGDPRIEYQPHNLELEGTEPLVQLVRRHRQTTTSVVVRDWDWTRSGSMKVESEQRGEGADGRERESYEHGRGRSLTISSYDQGVRRYQAEDSASQAQIRSEAHAVGALIGEGISRVVRLIPGAIVEVAGHPSLGFDGRYLVTRVEHVSEGVSAVLPEAGASDPYYNRFECIPAEVPHRPERRTRKPVISSIQTAVVTGPAGEEIHVDEHGRIRVQMHWDRQGASDERSTCWVRVQQPWAGSGWGFWWVPRIGMEVVVHFVDGDPDRPLVTASVYDGANATPYGLPGEKTKSTIKSNSSLGGGGFNELRFEDKAGSEEIYTHAQKDYNEVVENDHNTLVHHDQTNTVDNDQTQTIGVDQTETVHANQVMTVDGHRTVHVKSNFDETVDATETRQTKGDVSETFAANEARSIAANVSESIGGNETRTIGASHEETLGGNETVTVSGNVSLSVTGSRTENVTGGITQTTPGAYGINAAGGMSITAAGGIKFIAPGGATVIAPGGVTKVDSYFKWTGIQKMEVGNVAVEAFVFKTGITGVSLGYTAVKYEDTGIGFSNEGANLEQVGNSLKTIGAEIKNGAVWLKMKAMSLKVG